MNISIDGSITFKLNKNENISMIIEGSAMAAGILPESESTYLNNPLDRFRKALKNPTRNIS